jgi:hypothetical protein
MPLVRGAPGRRASRNPEGDHLTRFLGAHTGGTLTGEYLRLVLSELVAFHVFTVITRVPGPR